MNLIQSINSYTNQKVGLSCCYDIVDSTSQSFVSSTNKLSNVYSHEYENLLNKPLMSRGFWGELINKYWQETIFLSRSDSLSEKYMNQVKSDGLSIHGNQYKKFLFEFSKALVIGRIKASLSDINQANSIQNNSTDVKYIWRKGFNIEWKRYFLPKKTSYMNQLSITALKRIQDVNFPIFAVVNNLNQIIVAEPAENLASYGNLLDNIYKWCHSRITSQEPVHEALFFINVEDALEYKKYIENRYSNYNIYTNEEKLNTMSSRLDVYYNLTRAAHPKVSFRFIPDLKELGELLYKYQYYKNISFHHQQNYGKYHFQGQPIYIIQPLYRKNNITKTKDLVRYKYLLGINNTNSIKEYQAVFMNYKVALLAWHKFVKNHKCYNLPSRPAILVYNLEDFLKNDLKNQYLDPNKLNVLFIPNRTSYEFVAQSEQKSNYIHNYWYNQISYFRVMFKRLVWSLTTKQPIKL